METENLPGVGGGVLVGQRKQFGSHTATSYTVDIGQSLFSKVKKKEEELQEDEDDEDEEEDDDDDEEDEEDEHIQFGGDSVGCIDKDFEQFSTLNVELTSDHVPLGEILERLQSDDRFETGDRNNFIRLHAVTDNSASTISATVNVATLDLSCSNNMMTTGFGQNFSELNDVLFSINKAAASSTALNDSSTTTTTTDQSTSPNSTSSLLSSSSSSSFSPPAVPEVSTFLNNNNNNNIEVTNKGNCGGLLTVSTNAVLGYENNKTSPQECNLCNKMFGNASALAKHRLTHSAERKYLCTVCHKAFKRQDHLNGHLLTHRNKKPFECTTEGCNKSYCDARSLRRHRENHHTSKEDKLVSPASSVTSNGDFDEKSLGSDSFDSLKSPGSKGLLQVRGSIDQDKVAHILKSDIKNFSILEKYIRNEKDPSGGNSGGSVKLKGVGGTIVSRDGEVTVAMVECAICSRRFKNIPALNGHMRLHGGYYRKDNDKKQQQQAQQHKQQQQVQQLAQVHHLPQQQQQQQQQLVGQQTLQAQKQIQQRQQKQQILHQPQKQQHQLQQHQQQQQQQQQQKQQIQQIQHQKQQQLQSLQVKHFSQQLSPPPHQDMQNVNFNQKQEQKLQHENKSSLNEAISEQTHGSNVKNLIEEKIIQKRKMESIPSSTVTKQKYFVSSNGGIISSCSSSVSSNNCNSGIKRQSLSVPSCSNLTQCSTTLSYNPEPPTKRLACKPTYSSLSLVTTSLPSSSTISPSSTLSSSSSSSSSFDNLVFPVLPQPDTSKLLANLQTRQQQSQQQPQLANALNSSAPQLPNVPLPNNKCYNNNYNNVNNNNGNCNDNSNSVSVTNNGNRCKTSPVKSLFDSLTKTPHFFNLLKVDSTKHSAPRLGWEYQADLPPLLSNSGVGSNFDNKYGVLEDTSTLVWSPDMEASISEAQLDGYLKLSSSAALGPLAGSPGLTTEEALELLTRNGGDLFKATQEVLHLTPVKLEGRRTRDPWTPEQVDMFYEALCKNKKNFSQIAADIPGKTSQDCVEFYYLWKNLCREESQSFKSIINISQEEFESDLAM